MRFAATVPAPQTRSVFGSGLASSLAPSRLSPTVFHLVTRPPSIDGRRRAGLGIEEEDAALDRGERRLGAGIAGKDGDRFQRDAEPVDPGGAAEQLVVAAADQEIADLRLFQPVAVFQGLDHHGPGQKAVCRVETDGFHDSALAGSRTVSIAGVCTSRSA